MPTVWPHRDTIITVETYEIICLLTEYTGRKILDLSFNQVLRFTFSVTLTVKFFHTFSDRVFKFDHKESGISQVGHKTYKTGIPNRKPILKVLKLAQPTVYWWQQHGQIMKMGP